jgi:hypothetical protein
MADDLLQITAKTASRDVRLPTPPGGLMHLRLDASYESI